MTKNYKIKLILPLLLPLVLLLKTEFLPGQSRSSVAPGQSSMPSHRRSAGRQVLALSSQEISVDLHWSGQGVVVVVVVLAVVVVGRVPMVEHGLWAVNTWGERGADSVVIVWWSCGVGVLKLHVEYFDEGKRQSGMKLKYPLTINSDLTYGVKEITPKSKLRQFSIRCRRQTHTTH